MEEGDWVVFNKEELEKLNPAINLETTGYRYAAQIVYKYSSNYSMILRVRYPSNAQTMGKVYEYAEKYLTVVPEEVARIINS